MPNPTKFSYESIVRFLSQGNNGAQCGCSDYGRWFYVGRPPFWVGINHAWPEGSWAIKRAITFYPDRQVRIWLSQDRLLDRHIWKGVSSHLPGGIKLGVKDGKVVVNLFDQRGEQTDQVDYFPGITMKKITTVD